MVFVAPKNDESQDDEAAIFAEINITPLTDVILVLLIIFMVSSSAMVDAMREGKLDVTLPEAGTSASAIPDSDTLTISITADDRVFASDKEVAEDELSVLLKDTYKKKPQTLIVIQADGELHHKQVVHIIDVVRESGFKNIGIGTASGQ